MTFTCGGEQGDTADGWASYGHQWTQRLPYAKFIFPNAPVVRCSKPL
jgi:hypothetical protein